MARWSQDSSGSTAERFTAWYRQEYPDLILFALRMGARPADAPDLAQDACREIWSRWRAIDNHRAYARTTIRNRIGRPHEQAGMLGGPFDDIPEAIAPPDMRLNSIEFRDQERRIIEAIRALPPRQREVIAWTIDGYSPSEIALLLHVRSDTIRVNLHHARKKLRTSITGTGGDR